MDEITQWFENEFGYLGFMVTPTMYNPDNFVPVRGVLFRHPQVNGGHIFKTNILISTELTADVVVEYKQLLIEVMESFLNEYGISIDGFKDFKPVKKISKLKL